MNGAEIQSGAKPTPLRLLVFCHHAELGAAFLECVCPGARGGVGETIVANQRVHLQVCAGDPRLVPDWGAPLAGAQGWVLLLRFLDALSLDPLRAILRRLPIAAAPPAVVALFREENEADFKISCPRCGQKLWVSDAEVGRRGRCPNCHKAYRLLTPAEYLREHLALPASMPIFTTMRGRPESFRAALHPLVPIPVIIP